MLGKVADYHSDPLIILDTSFEIIFTNHKAISIFSIDDFNLTLDQIFEYETVSEITDTIGIVLNSSVKKNIKDLLIKLKGGSSLFYDVTVDVVNSDDSFSIILLFKNVSISNSEELISKIKISGTSGLTVQQNSQLSGIISDLQKHLPVTLVSLKTFNC